MSRIKDILAEVEYLYDEGYEANQISSMVGASLRIVQDCIFAIQDERDHLGTENDMEALSYVDDGDAYALASAGFGTDEDYGDFGDYE